MDERKQPPPLPEPLATFRLRESAGEPGRGKVSYTIVEVVKSSGRLKRADMRAARKRLRAE